MPKRSKAPARYRKATEQNAKKLFSDFCQLVHTTIGSSSAENLTVKAELGARLRQELLPFVLLTQTLERFYSKPRGNGGDFLTIDMIYIGRQALGERPVVGSGILGFSHRRAICNRVT